jgi:hypothetical protein
MHSILCYYLIDALFLLLRFLIFVTTKSSLKYPSLRKLLVNNPWMEGLWVIGYRLSCCPYSHVSDTIKNDWKSKGFECGQQCVEDAYALPHSVGHCNDTHLEFHQLLMFGLVLQSKGCFQKIITRVYWWENGSVMSLLYVLWLMAVFTLEDQQLVRFFPRNNFVRNVSNERIINSLWDASSCNRAAIITTGFPSIPFYPMSPHVISTTLQFLGKDKPINPRMNASDPFF